ncbi:MAG: hypothetical protein FWE23_08345 [Chitinivibrionia bacterium]|nr:hypothetical protein [Chitinivibrionia bacterium]
MGKRSKDNRTRLLGAENRSQTKLNGLRVKNLGLARTATSIVLNNISVIVNAAYFNILFSYAYLTRGLLPSIFTAMNAIIIAGIITIANTVLNPPSITDLLFYT